MLLEAHLQQSTAAGPAIPAKADSVLHFRQWNAAGGQEFGAFATGIGFCGVETAAGGVDGHGDDLAVARAGKGGGERV